jgi:hypothetical protein
MQSFGRGLLTWIGIYFSGNKQVEVCQLGVLVEDGNLYWMGASHCVFHNRR